jgi:hypothetical protein
MIYCHDTQNIVARFIVMILSLALQYEIQRCILYTVLWLTFKKSTFCPHCVFMCSVWISEQTAIISLYRINWMDLVTETGCVYCAVKPRSIKHLVLKGLNTTLKARSLPSTIKAQWSLYVPLGLTFKISTFCPYSLFMSSVWISKQTAIIFLYRINWMVFVTETEIVYCAVRTGSFKHHYVWFLRV